MIKKSKLGMLGMMSALMAFDLANYKGSVPQTRTLVDRNYKPYVPKPLPNNIMGTEVHKGHQVEVVKFVIETQNFIASISLPISGGSPKSLNKKRTSVGHELKEYVSKNTKEDLIKFGQFEITTSE